VLDPIGNVQHRGFQPLDIEIPPDAQRLRLHIGQGPKGSGSYDWTYWADLQILP
jgi:hypothetical protein